MTTSTSATATSTTAASSPPSTASSGAKGAEWRDISHHSGDNAPLSEVGRRSPREWGALAALLVGTAVLYLWNLSASGYANDFYAAAVQAGTKSWKAFFFGSIDSNNVITVDKPPASLWPMEISGRIFGFSSWSMLVPQAIMGVLAVWLLYATVRRWFGPAAGLLAGALLAITPVAVLMFRFNNPDAEMVLLIVLAAYCVTRALEKASTKWVLLAGAVVGFSFLAKGLQPFTVLPALAIAYLVAAPASLKRRLVQLLGAGVAIVVAAGWWILAVDLTPVADRPYIAGSGNNTALGLAFGYNGVTRLTGNGAGGGGGGSFSGTTGVGRLFNALNGGQIAWLLPAALLAIVALVVLSGRAARTDRTRAALIIWGGWLLVTGAVLSFASGVIHTYYTVEIAPAVAALVAIGTVLLWRHRAELSARIGLAAGAVVTGWWSLTLLHRSSGWHPWVAVLVIVAGIVAAIAFLIPSGRLRFTGVAAVLAGLIAITGGSVAYALNTASTAHTGSTPSAGPTVSGGTGGFGGGGGRGGFGGGGRGAGTGGGTGGTGGGFTRPTGGGNFTPPSGTTGGSRPGAGTGDGGTGTTGGATGTDAGATGSTGTGTGAARTGGGGRGGFGGGTTSVSSALVTLLKNAGTKWSAATVGAQSAAPLELQSGTAVIDIGGFSGSDPAPTLAQFEALVKAGKVHYFIGGGQGGGRGGNSAIATWVAAHYTSTTVGTSTVYDLTKATTS